MKHIPLNQRVPESLLQFQLRMNNLQLLKLGHLHLRKKCKSKHWLKAKFSFQLKNSESKHSRENLAADTLL